VFVVAPTSRALAAPPANDLIENATTITALPFTATQDSTDGTVSPSDPQSSCGLVSPYTLWYSYTAATDGVIRARASSMFPSPMVTVYEGSPGSLTEVGCAGESISVAAGTSYYLMVAAPGCCFGVFTLEVTVPPPPPANDLIENATPIVALPFTATQDNLEATVSASDPPPSCNQGFATSSVWYSYAAPVDGLIKAMTSGSGFSVPMATLYEGSPGALSQVGCGGEVVAVTAGATYYIRLSLPGCCPGTFTLNVTVPTPPANDLIENATPITTLPFSATQDNLDATVSPSDPPPSCFHGAATSSVWYSYAAPVDGLIKAMTSGSGFSVPMATLYKGSPGALSQVGCGGEVVAVTAGATYYIRLSLPGCCPGTFTLNVTVPTPPANDLIENATPITTLPFATTQDSTDATLSPTDPPSSCGVTSIYTLWYSYTAQTNGLAKVRTSSTIPLGAPGVTIYQGSPSSLTHVGCAGASAQIVPVTAGTSYYFMVSGCCRGNVTLEVTVPSPPANDLIENATPITTLPFSATQDSNDATRSPTDPASACVGGTVPTVWFSFTAPVDGLIEARTTGGFSTYLTAYDGQRESLSHVGCTFGGGSVTVPVASGKTYYLSVSALLHDTFTLDVRTLLTVSLPGDVIVEATGPSGASIDYTATATLPDGSPAPIDCTPASGSVLPVGDSTITCIASDNAGHTLTRGFVVHVVDTTRPTLSVPENAIVDATSPDGAVVTFSVSATDIVDLAPTITCDPPPGASFAIGDTTVHCVASDFSANSSDAAQFTVRVKGAVEQLRDLNDEVGALPGPAGVRISLSVKLELARLALARANRTVACVALAAFILEVRARSGGSIAPATATALIADGSRIRTVIGCGR
jgi:hypothetical protein